ncbi:MAG: Rpn family recombination-promoting nuclease/putative transposase [Cytophagales bacterium]|jgi:predicted transposase/invertase (TIGR01784 family)|nr:Rpn family recombination-promoting nuclease/putative transposase [Cytophagales bacterium]
MKAKYINPFTDFGFKKLFGEEVNKDLLIDFLNQLLPEKHRIKGLFYKKTENLGVGEVDRRAVFDIYCESESGDKFIVEMQKAKQNFFKDRTVFYSTFPIREQAEAGDWNFELKAVYCVAILDFVFDDHSDTPKFVHNVRLKDDNCKVFYDKLTFIFLEMPKFRKTESELETDFDKWLYFLKNLEKFDEIPARLRNRIFEKAFAIAEIARFNPAQMDAYETSLKYYRDLKNVIDTAEQEGREIGFQTGIKEGIEQGIKEGIKEGIKLVARQMRQNGVSDEDILKNTGLTPDEISNL